MTTSDDGTRGGADRTTPHLARRSFLAAGAAAGLAAASWPAIPNAAAEDLAGLRAAVRGTVVLPGEAAFEQARRPWKISVDQPVLAVVDVADSHDAAALVRYARQAGFTISPQSTGHGASPSLGRTILARMSELDEVRIDPGSAVARVGAGARWGAVQRAAHPHHLTGVVGSSPAVGVAGYTLGGGLSWFSRTFGWAAENVTGFETIDPFGESHWVTDTTDTELFWALRGGGGEHALVTAVEIRLHPVDRVYGGRMAWPAAKAREVLTAFRATAELAPDELTVWFNMTRPPNGPAITGVDCAFIGGEAAAREAMALLERITGRVADTRRVLPTDEMGAITNEPSSPTPIRDRGTLISALPDDLIDRLLTTPLDPLLFLQIRHLGGALARTSSIPAGTLTEPYFAYLGGLQIGAHTADAIDARIDEFLGLLAPVNTHRTVYTFLAANESAAHAFDEASLARLQNLKRSRDPNGVLQGNHPILT